MLDFSLTEMLVVAVMVLVFVGPDDLPKLLSTVGKYYAKLRRASDELRRAFNVEIAKVEADERRDQLRRRKDELEKRGLMPPPDAAPREPRRPPPTPPAPEATEPAPPAAPATPTDAAAEPPPPSQPSDLAG